jgi:hypothetical protein
MARAGVVAWPRGRGDTPLPSGPSGEGTGREGDVAARILNGGFARSRSATWRVAGGRFAIIGEPWAGLEEVDEGP